MELTGTGFWLGLSNIHKNTQFVRNKMLLDLQLNYLKQDYCSCILKYIAAIPNQTPALTLDNGTTGI